MAWGSNTNPVSVGDATKKVHYDNMWDKLQYIKDSVIPAATKMLFGQSSAPSGWTKDTATWTTDSMIIFTTGSIGSGGSDSPSSAHGHSMQSHTHTLADGGSYTSQTTQEFIIKSGGLLYTPTSGAVTYEKASYTTGGPSTANTGNHTPKYQTVIAATKDTYT